MGFKCPSCNFDNISGVDRCERCLHSLMQLDIPRPKKDDALQRAIMTDPIIELVTGKDLLVASPGDSVLQIIKIFSKENKNCVLIYNKKKLVGILTNRDILNRVAGKFKDLSKVKAEQVMTANPESVKETDPIAYVVNKMSMGGFRHIPVLRPDGTPYSIITIKDVLSYIASRIKGKSASPA